MKIIKNFKNEIFKQTISKPVETKKNISFLKKLFSLFIQSSFFLRLGSRSIVF